MMNEGVKEEHMNGDKPVMPNGNMPQQQPVMPNGNMPQQQPVMQFLPPPQDTMYHTKVKENFNIYGVATFLFACLYAFCVYRNPSGITYLLFVSGVIFYVNFCLKKLEIKKTKGQLFYIISMILLAISTFCTDDGRIIFFNKLGVFLLTISMLIGIFYDTQKWNLGTYLAALLKTSIGSITELDKPFRDLVWYSKNKMDKKKSKYLYVLLGLIAAVPLVITVLLLLTSADIVFKDIVHNVLSKIKFGNIALTVWLVLSMFLYGYAILVLLCRYQNKAEARDNRTGEPLIAITIACILSILYVVFSGVQIMYLFIGNMELPDGYTYAEYAREGFFQLLAVGILNLIIVLVGLCFFRPNKLLKVILAIMSACTFVMLISSAMRMIIYIQYYYLTFFRILVLWSLVALFGIFVGVIIYIFKENFPLFRYCMVIVTVLYIGLSFSHPDYWIAKVNLAGEKENNSNFFKGAEYYDYDLLSKLNADAAPVMLEWAEKQGVDLEYYFDCKEEDHEKYNGPYTKEAYAYKYMERLSERVGEITPRRFNISEFMAERLVTQKTGKGN